MLRENPGNAPETVDQLLDNPGNAPGTVDQLRENPGNAPGNVNQLRDNSGNATGNVDQLREIPGSAQTLLRENLGIAKGGQRPIYEGGKTNCGKFLGLLVCRPIAGNFWECSDRLKINLRHGDNQRAGKFWECLSVDQLRENC